MRKLYKFFLVVIVLYLIVMLLGFSFQAKLIFFPGKLPRNFTFSREAEELFLKTSDGEEINALYFPGSKKEVILYFHGNAGDLSGWQHVAADFTTLGYSFLIIDYRGYGKSSGSITEKGMYEDAEASYKFLIDKKGFNESEIIFYGRSIGTGVAVELAKRHRTKGLILESPYSSLKKLANEKVPYLLPSLYLRYHFDNLKKISDIKCPVLFFHGANDTLIPSSHTDRLYEAFRGKKEKIILPEGTHNDVNGFPEYHTALSDVVPKLFSE